MDKHTTGPWRAERCDGGFRRFDTGDWQIVSDDLMCPALVWGGAGFEKIGEANARLIAAAPAMLAALQLALPHIDNADSPGGCDGSHDGCDHCLAIRSVREAIAKATE